MMWQLREYSVPMSPWIPHLGLQVSQVASAPPPPPASSATSSGPPEGTSASSSFPGSGSERHQGLGKSQCSFAFFGFDFGASQL